MLFIRRHLRRFTGFAIFAMLVLAFAPGVTQARNGLASGSPWSEVCSASGAGPSAPGEHAVHLEHCPLCCQLAAAPMLPVAEPDPLPSVDGADDLPALFALAPRPLHAWAAAPSRGPPAAS